jgi:hypothetical protein
MDHYRSLLVNGGGDLAVTVKKSLNDYSCQDMFRAADVL